MDGNEKTSFDYMKVNKDNIQNVIKNNTILDLINDLSIKTNKIIIHSYNYIKLYILHLYEKNLPLPFLNRDFISDVFKVLTKRICKSGGYKYENMPERLKNLTDFYNDHYSKTTDKNEILYYDKLSHVLAYDSIDMEKNIYNNIREHYVQHVNKFVNAMCNIHDVIENINNKKISKEDKKIQKQNIYKQAREVKNDLLSLDPPKSLKKYHPWVLKHRKFIQPDKKIFDKNSIVYDLKSNTKDYLKPLIYIGKKLEIKYNKIKEKNKKIEEENNKNGIDPNKNKIKQIKLFNILPLRTNIIPKNITIDTCGLIQNFLGTDSINEHLHNYKIGANQYNLWKRCFKLDKRIFKKNKYTFNFMIKTDGVSVSVLFIRIDNVGNPVSKNNRRCKNANVTDYIEKIKLTPEIKNKKIVCCDPGMSDLLYCGSYDENGVLETFRYTQNQRRVETGKKRYSKIRDTLSKNTEIHTPLIEIIKKIKIIDRQVIIVEKENTLIHKQTIKEIETDLSKYNSRVNNYDDFEKYLIEKNKTNSKIFEYYEQKLFRKFKLNSFTNTQKSESKMLNNFKKKFGDSKNTIFVIGDSDKGSNQMHGVEPTILKRIRRLFKNAGYPVYLINEFCTSKICNYCNGELEKFLTRMSKKPKDIIQKKQITVHGLLRCTNVTLCSN